jgi:hypothetical protein
LGVSSTWLASCRKHGNDKCPFILSGRAGRGSSDFATNIINVLEDLAGTRNKTYPIKGPEYYSFTQIIHALLHAMHKTGTKTYAPTPLVGVGAAFMDTVLPKPP